MTDELALALVVYASIPLAWLLIEAFDLLVGWFAGAPDALEEVAA